MHAVINASDTARHAPADYEDRSLMLLCTDAPRHGWSTSELALFATHFDGWCEPLGADNALFCFERPQAALRAAMLLQRIGADTKIRVSLTFGDCAVAVSEEGGEPRRSLLPPHDALALDAMGHASAGSVVISREAYPILEPMLAREVGNALVTTEFHADDVAQVSITLLPAASAALSTFAGLGLS